MPGRTISAKIGNQAPATTAGRLSAAILSTALAFAGAPGSISGLIPSAMADDQWNPFAEKDRQAAKRSARREPSPTNPTSPPTYVAPPGSNANAAPYLAPMERVPSGIVTPRPYPSVPPGYALTDTYQPRGQPTGRPYNSSQQSPYRRTPDLPPGQPYGAPGTYVPTPPPGSAVVGSAAPRVERGELTPVISSGNGLPDGTWQGLDAAATEQLLGTLKLPPASPALADLFNRIMSEPVADQRLNAVRTAALLKAGHFELAARLQGNPEGSAPTGTVLDLLNARLDLATNNTEQGCRRIKAVVATPNKLPKNLRGEAIVTAGYCAIVAGNRQAGGLAAELARDAGYNRPFTLAILEAIASGDSVRAPVPRTVTTLDGLLLRRLSKSDPALFERMLQNATPGFLQLIATDPNANPALRLKAAERAAQANVTSPAALAEAYRAVANNSGGAEGPAIERARQFNAAERNQAQFAKTRAIRALLDSARRDGLFHATAVAAAPIVRNIRPAQEIFWFTETAVEVLAATGDYQTARRWVRAAPQAARSSKSLDHWLMLLDVADPEVNKVNRGASIAVLENLALQGRFSQPALHRLATVLDALDYNVPIPLWNLASRSEQPQTGHLPATGLLSAMKSASEARQIAATALYALRTIAPAGTSATHLLGLGEAIRALKRSGLEKDARRLAFEALFGDWPRTGQ